MQAIGEAGALLSLRDATCGDDDDGGPLSVTPRAALSPARALTPPCGTAARPTPCAHPSCCRMAPLFLFKAKEVDMEIGWRH
ncbi:unnamed protein product [Lampetra fluviatilis]